jgi:pimeloyl-ACP methyl ester carboxylesterase
MKTILILLPGFAADQNVWKYQIEQLSELVIPQVIVLKEQSSRAEMADAVLRQAPEKFALAGHSMGGWVAQEIAAKAPERILSLILVGTWTNDNPQMIEGQNMSLQMIQAGQFETFLRFLLSILVFSKNQAILPHVEQLLRKCPNQVLCQQLKAMNAAYGTQPLLKKISSPTLIIHGRQDALVSLEEGHALARGIQNSKLEIIEECGHMPPIECPSATSMSMRNWLESTLPTFHRQ